MVKFTRLVGRKKATKGVKALNKEKLQGWRHQGIPHVTKILMVLQAIAMLENRVCTLESTVLSAHDGRMSLKLEYVEKCNAETGINGSGQSVGSLSQSIQALQRCEELIIKLVYLYGTFF